MTAQRTVGFVLAATLAVAACRAIAPALYMHTSIGTGNWVAIEINGHTAAPANQAQRPWLHFSMDTGIVTGSGGCNRLSGPVMINRSSLKFGALAMTRKACTDSVLNAQENEFVASLGVVDRYELSADTLILFSGYDSKVRLGH